MEDEDEKFDDDRACEGAAGAGVNATQSRTTPTGAGLPCRPKIVAEPHTCETMIQHGGVGIVGAAGSGRGRGRGRGGIRSNYRGASNQIRGGYDKAGSSSYAYSQPRHQYGHRQSSWDSAQDEHQPHVAQQPRTGRGRGGNSFGQQNAIRRPYRASGRFRGSCSRRRRLACDHLSQQHAGQDMAAMSLAQDQVAGHPSQAADFETTSLLQHEVEALTAEQQGVAHRPVHLPNESVSSTESGVLLTAVPEPYTPEQEATNSSPSLVRPDQTSSLVSDTSTEVTQPQLSAARHDQATLGIIIDPSSPTRHVNWQVLPFHAINNHVHPNHAPEMVYAWYPYAVMPAEGAHSSPPLQSPLIMTSAPPLPPLPQPRPRLPPPHFYFTHDHAFLALCHPFPLMPCMSPIPYLRYWGPEGIGAHPNFYDVPMFASDV